MKIKSDDISIHDFLTSNFLSIPRFQRPYSWEPEQVNDFWQDLIENAETEYFIGSMVVYSRGRQEIGIVDGQQRLTTITLLLCALRNEFSVIGEKELAEGLNQLIERKDIDNELTPVLRTESSYPYFQDKIQSFDGSELDLKPSPEETNLSKAFEILVNKISNTMRVIDEDPATIEDLKKARKVLALKKIRKSVLELNLIQVILDNENDAYIIFETLNTRGKDLELSDLVKNHFARLIPKKGTVDYLKEKWTSFLETFESSQADISPNVFITHYWNSKFEFVTQKRVFSLVKKKVKKDGAKIELQKILEDATYYRAIYEPTFGWKAKEESRIVKALQAIQLFRLSQPTPAILSLVRSYHHGNIRQKDLVNALVSIENFHFLFTAVTSSRSSGGISAMYSSFGRAVYECKSAQEFQPLLVELKGKMNERRPSQSEFSAGFSEVLYTGSKTKQRALVRYILEKLARHRGYTYPADYSELTIEHLYPLSAIGGDWSENVVGQIGNLAFVTKGLNDELGVKTPNEKRGILKNSPEWSPSPFTDADSWTPTIVRQTTSDMADLAYETIWKI